MQDRQKMYRREATTDRALAVALYHECRRHGMKPRAERNGAYFVVVAHANEWALWRALNRARQTVAAKRQAEDKAATDRARLEVEANELRHLIANDMAHGVRHALALQLSSIEAQLAPATVATSTAVPAYFDDTWATDKAITENPKTFRSHSLAYIDAIRAAAVSAGYDVNWGRVDGKAVWEIEVWDCSQSDFSALLESASQGAHAIAA